jgi:hypothetical protein
MFRNVLRRLDNVIGGEGLVKSLDLPRKDLYRQLLLRLYANVNITTLGAPVLYAHSPSKYLKRIELIADGKDTIKSINMKAMVLKNFFHFSRYPARTVPALATGDNKFYQTIVLPCALPRAVREIDTLIDSGRLSTFNLQLSFGAKADIFATAPTAYTLANLECKVHLLESLNVENKPLTFGVYKETYIEKEVTQTQNEFQVLLPVGNVYRGFLIEAEVAGDPNDLVINSVQLRSGTTVFFKSEWLDLRDFCATNMNMETQSFTGYAYIDFCPEGRIVDALNASQLSMLEAIFDVTKQSGINFIRIYPDEVIIPSLVRG